MIVPGKNLSDPNKTNSKKTIWIYIGLGVTVLIIGIILLFKFVIFSPEEEEVKEGDIEKIIGSVKKENHGETPVYGGLTENEKKFKKSFEEKNTPEIDKDMVVKNKESSAPATDIKPAVMHEQKEVNKEMAKTETNNKKEEPKVEKKPSASAVIAKQETPKPEKKVEEAIKPKNNGDNSAYKFTIQIASFKEADNAKKDKSILESKKFETELKRVDLGAKGIWYRLRVGKYKTMEEAKTELWEVKSVGFSNASITTY